ncbi:MAG: nucleotidyltransferase family protein [Nitrospirae bacterium]|nr:nucleotidyltransferase family protein [Nitrospirota bacterium]MBF0592399.1 nucleotidyltransferase family protein [Nitrospirota bacterium]
MDMRAQEIEERIISVLTRHDATMIGLFGSYARGQETPNSDIDILVNFNDTKSLLELVAIERELTESINQKVDLLTEHSISPYLIDNIKKDLRVIYK